MDSLVIPFEERDSVAERRGQQLATASTKSPGWVMKKLTPRHRQIAALLISGLQYEDIAKLARVHKNYIVMLRRQPLFDNYLKELQTQVEDEFKNLLTPAVAAIRDGLDPALAKVETRLNAAKVVLETQGRLKGRDVGSESAEDVARRLVMNFQINVGGPS